MPNQNIQVRSSINETDSKITLSGLSEEEIIIVMEEDVNFTQLVHILEKNIDKNESIEFVKPKTDSYSEKTVLVIETVSEIFDAFNNSSITDEDDTIDDAEYDSSENDIDDLSDDIPF